MALEGNVKDFGLSEIFQLIGLQNKSGMLSVTGEETMAVFFKDGLVVSTRDRRNRTRDPLKDYLMRYGFISTEEMHKIQRIQVETNYDLTDILISEKYFSEEELKAIFTDQIQESFQEVLSWPKSYYKFIIGKHVLHGVKSYALMKVEGLLMESMRRIDEFPEMLRIFPSEEIVVKRIKTPPEELPGLESGEEFLYELLEEGKRVGEIVSQARMARFCTYEALKNLLEKELLDIVEEPPSEETKPEEPVAEVKRSGKKRVLPTMAAVIVLTASFAVGEYAIPSVLEPGWSATRRPSGRRTNPPAGGLIAQDVNALKLKRLESAVRDCLEEYNASTGSYPFTLEVLAVRGFAPNELIEQAHLNGFSYSLGSEDPGYILERN